VERELRQNGKPSAHRRGNPARRREAEMCLLIFGYVLLNARQYLVAHSRFANSTVGMRGHAAFLRLSDSSLPEECCSGGTCVSRTLLAVAR
jgi:hypothetical protein